MNRRNFLQLAGLSVVSPLLMGRQVQAQRVPKLPTPGVTLLVQEPVAPKGDAYLCVVTKAEAVVRYVADGKTVAVIFTHPGRGPFYSVPIPHIEQYQHVYIDVQMEEQYAMLHAWITEPADPMLRQLEQNEILEDLPFVETMSKGLRHRRLFNG